MCETKDQSPHRERGCGPEGCLAAAFLLLAGYSLWMVGGRSGRDTLFRFTVPEAIQRSQRVEEVAS